MHSNKPRRLRLATLAIILLLATAGMAAGQATYAAEPTDKPAYDRISDKPAYDRASDKPSTDRADARPTDRPGDRPPDYPHPCERVFNAARMAASAQAGLHSAIAAHVTVLRMLDEKENRTLEALEGNRTENQTAYLEKMLERIQAVQGHFEERLEQLRERLAGVQAHLERLRPLVERCKQWWGGAGEETDIAPDVLDSVAPVAVQPA